MNIETMQQMMTTGLHSTTAMNTKHSQSATQKSAPKQAFSAMLEQLKSEAATTQTLANPASTAPRGVSQSLPSVHLNGDYIRSMVDSSTRPAETKAQPQGAGSRSFQARDTQLAHTIDKSSKLYEQSLELESFFVKIMIDSMRKTLSNSTLAGEQSFAGKMYHDMMYDQMSRDVTKNAGFGLADQIYLQFKA